MSECEIKTCGGTASYQCDGLVPVLVCNLHFNQLSGPSNRWRRIP